jgi:hypothetical protein
LNTDLFQRIHAQVWTFRAYMDTHTPWTTPNTYDSLRFAVVEAHEILDARQRQDARFARNNHKDKSVVDECGDYVLMALTALGKNFVFKTLTTEGTLEFDNTLDDDGLIDDLGWCAANALHWFNTANRAKNDSPFLNRQWAHWLIVGLGYSYKYVGDDIEHVVWGRMERILHKYCPDVEMSEVMGDIENKV